MRFAFFYLLSLLPFSVLYVLSDIMAFLAGRVFRYRRAVILKNLRNAFPEKDTKELYDLLPGIYRNLTDVMIETFKLITLKEQDLLKRAVIMNTEIIDKFYRQNTTVIAVTSHECNWEWLLAVCSLRLSAPIDGVFQQIKSRFFNSLMLRIRGRFGALPVEKNEAFRESLKKRNIPHIIALVADQSPPRADANVYWTRFLNQETAFFNGMARLATGLNWPVLHARMTRLKRGYYEIEFIEIETRPSQAKSGEILEKYVKTVEKSIVDNPENWLWSHNRWKRKPPAGGQQDSGS